MKDIYPPTLLCDFYKLCHRVQLPDGTEEVCSVWTPRASLMPGVDHVVAFGFQAFVQHYLVDYFEENFFARPLDEVLHEYSRIVRNCLGVADPDVSHLAALHSLGYLPLEIKALPEGSLAPLRVPMLTVRNTLPEYFWLTNYIETIFSSETWMPTTSATIAHEYRKLLDHWADVTGAVKSDVAFQGHDFSFRGMPGVNAAAASGAGHLLSFTGTDTPPAVVHLEHYYDCSSDDEVIGMSIPATEHAVMSAYGPEKECETFLRLLTETYPSGFVSVVSDTWDLWRVIGEYLPRLRAVIMGRDGRLVIRPDSGDPVKILVGDPDSDNPLARKGVIECLADIFGYTVNEKGYKVLDPHIGAIYGDSITLDRAAQILSGLAAKGFVSTSIVLGIGSFTYQYNTRDTFGHAMKSTNVIIYGDEKAIFKDPATDLNHLKRSPRGRIAVVWSEGDLVLVDHLTIDDVTDGDLLQTILVDGQIRNRQTLGEIRGRLASASLAPAA
jgi:nicotinamide phosphoribosyltransferase